MRRKEDNPVRERSVRTTMRSRKNAKFVIGIHIQRGQKRKVIDSTENMEQAEFEHFVQL